MEKIKVLFKYSKSKNQDDLFDEIANQLYKSKIVNNKNNFIDDLKNREQQFSTNFGQGFAIPHTQSKYVNSPCCVFVSFKKSKEINFDSKGPIKFAIFLLFPIENHASHVKLLGRISAFLLDRGNESKVYSLDEEFLNNFIIDVSKDVSNRRAVTSDYYDKTLHNKYIDIAAVSTCPLKKITSFLAGKSLDISSKNLGYNFKCEYLSSDNPINELSRQDIANADIIILIGLTNKSNNLKRFYGKKVYFVKNNLAIKDGKDVILNAIKCGKILKKSQKNNQAQINQIKPHKRINLHKGFIIFKNDLFKGLFNGVNWMIPLVVIGGIFLALSLAIGGGIYSDVNAPSDLISKHPTSILTAFYYIGSYGLLLMIAILGGFIAVAIGGKMAFAPAFILSWFCNFSTVDNNLTNVNPTFYNYITKGFGLPNGQLGFIGAIFIGIIVGYMVRLIIHYTTSAAAKPYVTTLFIPIFVTLITWALFAFCLSYPLSYCLKEIEIGLQKLARNSQLIIVLGVVLSFLIVVDMGGVFNKVAFFTAAQFIVNGGSETQLGEIMMGINGAAVGVPPLGMALYSFVGKKYKASTKEDRDFGVAATVLGVMGITEGAIPFAVKYPKSAFIANISGGIVAGIIAAGTHVYNLTTHGSLIVYFLGNIGRNNTGSDYVYGLYFVLAIIVGSLVTGIVMLVLTKYFYYNSKSKEKSYFVDAVDEIEKNIAYSSKKPKIIKAIKTVKAKFLIENNNCNQKSWIYRKYQTI